MLLQPRTVGPYLAALRAALRAHAPDEDFVPLVEIDNHLIALQPTLSGELLLPAEVNPMDGLPHHNWLTRARAEGVLAREVGSEVSAPNAALGEEYQAIHQARARLHAHLRSGPLLPSSRLVAKQRYLGQESTFRVQFDHLLPGAGWMRVRADVSGRFEEDGGLFQVRADDRVRVDDGLKHLFIRHGTTPLLVLLESLSALLLVDIHRLSRTFVGPFWFPGLPLPEDVPDILRDTLVLHLFQELVGRDVSQSTHQDPWVPPTLGVEPPGGMGLFRERRLWVPRSRVEGVCEWADARGGAVVVGF
jgi:hypothetical protein